MIRSKFYRKTLILSVSTLFLLTIVFPSELALAQGVNYAGSANGGVASETGAVSGTASGAVVNTNDDSLATYWDRRKRVGGAGAGTSAYGYFTIEIPFAETVATLEEVKYKVGWHSQTEGSDGKFKYWWTLSCSIYYSGAWHVIKTESYYASYQSWTRSRTSSVTIPGPWNDVTKVKIYVHTRTEQNRNYHTIFAGVTLYELEAFGPPPAPAYQDIGLRVFDGNETIVIAAEPTGTLTSPLRIAKNGTIYGIALVDPEDPNDSGVRIQTSSGVIKALRKY